MGRLKRIFAIFCCCFCATEPLGDGSEFRKAPEADPREKDIDAEFMARNYTRDASGRFHTTPTSSTVLEVKPSHSTDHNAPEIPILKVEPPTASPDGLPWTNN
ncbi:hypothetical protein BKA70DRAFT_1424726 [Coprinopsis sp. MPI-PUGE-AT-0042]|nr:hypothetical protein BKA70DRAFT_1424726 [Coprinopsis sp. MPI-PUGE-AT-0042]